MCSTCAMSRDLSPGPARSSSQVKAAGINPGEAAIRKGLMRDICPRRSRQDRAATSRAWSPKQARTSTNSSVGDEVIGFSDKRASHAEFVVVPAENLTAKPAAVSWEVAGALYVAGTTAYAAVRAVDARAGRRGGGRRRRGRCRHDRGAISGDAGATVHGYRGPVERRVAAHARRHPGQLRRRAGRAGTGRGAHRTGRRLPGLLRRRLCGTGG